jgi:hypothetical protein
LSVFADVDLAVVDLFRVGFGCADAPFGFSKCARMSFARSKISFGKPASRAT